MVSYNPQFNPTPWVDGVHPVQAAGNLGFNKRFQDIVTEFTTLSQVISQLNAGLVFLPVGAAGAVSYGGGNVGIGTAFSGNSPTYRLEVDLSANTSTTQQVRFGNAVCCNGSATFREYAVFAHQDHASNPNNEYALRQGPDGNVHINAVSGQVVSIRQGGTNVRLAISTDGNVIVGGENDQGTAQLQVNGDAAKSGGGTWSVLSDARLKKDVREFEAGLTQLRRVRPVRFRYNGRAGTPAGQEGVGVLGQEIEKIFPEMIRHVPGGLHRDPDLQDLRIYDGSALTFVLVNAVNELAGKVELLEQALAAACNNRAADGASDWAALTKETEPSIPRERCP